MMLWWVMLLGVCFRMSLCRLECRSDRLCVLGVLSFLVPRIWGHVRSPLMGGSASVIIMFGVFSLLQRRERLRTLLRCV